MDTTFDTLKIYERLKAADLPDKAAKEIAEVFKETIDENVTTKRDLKELENLLKQDLKEFELRLKHDLTVRMGKMLAWQTGVFIAVVAALMKLIK